MYVLLRMYIKISRIILRHLLFIFTKRNIILSILFVSHFVIHVFSVLRNCIKHKVYLLWAIIKLYDAKCLMQKYRCLQWYMHKSLYIECRKFDWILFQLHPTSSSFYRFSFHFISQNIALLYFQYLATIWQFPLSNRASTKNFLIFSRNSKIVCFVDFISWIREILFHLS